MNDVALSDGERVEGDLAADGVGEDSGLAAQDGEFDVGAGVVDDGLAGETVVVAQEAFGVGGRAEGVHAAPYLDDALVALAGATAGGRDAHAEVVGVVEDGAAGDVIEGLAGVVDGGHGVSFEAKFDIFRFIVALAVCWVVTGWSQGEAGEVFRQRLPSVSQRFPAFSYGGNFSSSP